MVKEFRDFLMRGNIVELAVAVVIAVAFEAVVTSLADHVIMPIVGIFGGSPDFSANTFSVNGSEFRWGAFVTTLVSFAIVAAVVFFLVVRPMNALLERVRRGEVSAAEEVLPPTWEYRTAPEGDLNRLGAEGWELAGVDAAGGFHLKRPRTSTR